jgi:hypothetical protein
MPPADFSMRSRRKGRWIAPAVLGLLVVAAILVFVGTRGTSKKTSPPGSPTPISFGLSDTGFTPYVEGKQPGADAMRADRTAVRTMLDSYYRAAFVDPADWKDPTFPALAAMFTGDARASFARDLASLTIGDGRADFVRVVPSSATVHTAVYYKDAQPSWAVAVVAFRATATTRTHRSVLVVQDATFRLSKAAGGWTIFSYDASEHQDTPTPSPSGSAS